MTREQNDATTTAVAVRRALSAAVPDVCQTVDPEGSGRLNLHGLMSPRKKAVNTIVAMVEMPSRNSH